MADDGDMKDILQRLAALEKRDADHERRLADVGKEFGDSYDSNGQTAYIYVDPIERAALPGRQHFPAAEQCLDRRGGLRQGDG